MAEIDLAYLYVYREKELDSLYYNIIFDSDSGGYEDVSIAIFFVEWETHFVKEKGTDQGGVSQDFVTLVVKCFNASGLFLHTQEL